MPKLVCPAWSSTRPVPPLTSLRRRPQRRLLPGDPAQGAGDGRAAHRAGRRGTECPVSAAPRERRRRRDLRSSLGFPAHGPGGARGHRGRRGRGRASPHLDTDRRGGRGPERRAGGVRLVELDVQARHPGGGRMVGTPAAGRVRRRRRTPPDLPHLVRRARARKLHARAVPDLLRDQGRVWPRPQRTTWNARSPTPRLRRPS
jgi:hypothetical protein